MIERELKGLSLSRQCELLSINRTRIYYTQSPGPGCGYKQVILRQIDQIHTEHPYYGSRRITAVLIRRGHNVNRKRIQGYMREMAIVVYYPSPNLSKRNRQHKVYPYLLKKLAITRKNQVWSIDITYIPMSHGHMYLFAIIDWFTREIVDFELSNSLDTTFITTCLKRAFEEAMPEIINSDQGSQFTSNEYINLLKSEGIRISMDSVGRATDNNRIELFFRSLKQEKLYIYAYESVNELKTLIQEYMKYYNTERPHQSLGYATPAEVSKAA